MWINDTKCKYMFMFPQKNLAHKGLIHCGLRYMWYHMMTKIWVNLGSGNGLMPHGTKPLPEPMLTFIKGVLWRSPENSHKKMLMNYIYNLCSEITLLKSLPHLREANELNELNDMGLKLHRYTSNINSSWVSCIVNEYSLQIRSPFHTCWCPGSTCHQFTRRRDVEY